MEAGSAPSEPRYNGSAVAGAVLATIFFPLIALIAALILLGNERNPQRRSQLRTWAWTSGGFMLFVFVLFLVLQSVTL
jgi:phosphoglycerol transferase MdoB-like AlkP superfamily enzyme